MDRCKRCNGFGVYFSEGKTPAEIIHKCEDCFNSIKKQVKSLRNIYKDSDSFIENENKLQHELDYRDSNEFKKANGSEKRNV